jgi:hypothetical protein
MIALKLAVAGIGHLVADYSALSVLAGGLIALAFLSQFIPVVGPFLTKFRADLLWAAALLIAMLLWGAHIQHDTNLQWQAKQAVLDKAVEKIVTQTTPKPAASHKAPRDRWDRKGN